MTTPPLAKTEDYRGLSHFRHAFRASIKPPSLPEMPKPDDQWGVWVEYRLTRLEDRQQWMTRLILGALVMQVGLQVLSMFGQ